MRFTKVKLIEKNGEYFLKNVTRNLDSNLIHITSENSKYSIEEIFDDRGIKYYTLSQYENSYVLRDYGISAIANAIDIYLKSKLGIPSLEFIDELIHKRKKGILDIELYDSITGHELQIPFKRPNSENGSFKVQVSELYFEIIISRTILSLIHCFSLDTTIDILEEYATNSSTSNRFSR